jgi:hypothetical protein
VGNLESEVDRYFRARNIGIFTGIAFTGSCDALAKFRDLLIYRCQIESIRLIPVDISGQWLLSPAEDGGLEPEDLIVVWGLECLDAHDNRAYSLRTLLDIALLLDFAWIRHFEMMAGAVFID